jgi:hypothetical protein
MIEIPLFLIIVVFVVLAIVFIAGKIERGPKSLQMMMNRIRRSAQRTFVLWEIITGLIIWLLYEIVQYEPWASIVGLPAFFVGNMLLSLTLIGAVLVWRLSGYSLEMPNELSSTNEIFEAEVQAWDRPEEGLEHVKQHIHETEEEPDQVLQLFLQYLSKRDDKLGRMARDRLSEETPSKQ